MSYLQNFFKIHLIPKIFKPLKSFNVSLKFELSRIRINCFVVIMIESFIMVVHFVCLEGLTLTAPNTPYDALVLVCVVLRMTIVGCG